MYCWLLFLALSIRSLFRFSSPRKLSGVLACLYSTLVFTAVFGIACPDTNSPYRYMFVTAELVSLPRTRSMRHPHRHWV